MVESCMREQIMVVLQILLNCFQVVSIENDNNQCHQIMYFIFQFYENSLIFIYIQLFQLCYGSSRTSLNIYFINHRFILILELIALQLQFYENLIESFLIFELVDSNQ